MEQDMLERMLELQHELQTETYGHNFQRMLSEDRIRYIKDAKLSLEAELQEALDEVGWKPWATSRHINRDAYVGELVDVFHFFMNMLLVLGDDPRGLAAELFTRYCIKNRVNVDRQVSGYDGVSTKCLICNRALDDSAVKCWRRGDQGYCAKIVTDIKYIKSNHEKFTQLTSILCPRCGDPVDAASPDGCDPQPRIVGNSVTGDGVTSVITGAWCARHGTYEPSTGA